MKGKTSVGRPKNGPYEALIAKLWHVFFHEASGFSNLSGHAFELKVKQKAKYAKSALGNYIKSGMFSEGYRQKHIPSLSTQREVEKVFQYDFSSQREFLKHPFFNIIQNPSMSTDELNDMFHALPEDIFSLFFIKIGNGERFQRDYNFQYELQTLHAGASLNMLTACLCLLCEAKRYRDDKHIHLLSVYAYDIFIRASILYPLKHIHRDLFEFIRPFFFAVEKTYQLKNDSLIERYIEERDDYLELTDLYERNGILNSTPDEKEYFLRQFNKLTYEDSFERLKNKSKKRLLKEWEVTQVLKNLQHWRKRNRSKSLSGSSHNSVGSPKSESADHLYENLWPISSEYAKRTTEQLVEDMCENIEEEFELNQKLLTAYFSGFNYK